MKPKTKNQETFQKERFVLITMLLLCISLSTSAQQGDSVKTLFRPGITVSELWAPEVRINSIQGETETLVGFQGGAVFNKSFMLGISGGVNLSHPRVNYGNFGAIAKFYQYPAVRPDRNFQEQNRGL